MSAAKNISHAAHIYGLRVRDGNVSPPSEEDKMELRKARVELEVAISYIDYLTGDMQGDPAADAGLIRYRHEGRAA